MRSILTSMALCGILVLVGCSSDPFQPPPEHVGGFYTSRPHDEMGPLETVPDTLWTTPLQYWVFRWDPPSYGAPVMFYVGEADWKLEDEHDVYYTYLDPDERDMYVYTWPSDCVRVRVAAVGFNGQQGPWSEWSETVCAKRETTEYDYTRE